LYSPLLTEEVQAQFQPEAKFRQFAKLREEWGRNAGETFLFDKYGDVDTQGGQLTETDTIPSRGYRLYQATATLYEYGNSIPWTRKYEDLDQIEHREGPVTTLKNDLAKVIDTLCEAQFDAAKRRYVGTATGGGAFTTDGTATATATSAFNKYHVKQMVDYMFQTLKNTPYDNDGNYMALCSTNAKRGVYDDMESMLQYTKFPASGEFGKFYECRFARTNHAISNAIGNGSSYGEAYMFGEYPICEGVAVAPEIRPKLETDFGRSKGLAWYAILGYKIFHFADPDDNIIKFDSA
jgi:N4-gp56 family major capsid protein